MVLPGRAEVNTMVDLGKLAGTEKGAVWRTRVANRDASVGNLQARASLFSSVKCLAVEQAVTLLERLSHWLLSGWFSLCCSVDSLQSP